MYVWRTICSDLGTITRTLLCSLPEYISYIYCVFIVRMNGCCHWKKRDSLHSFTSKKLREHIAFDFSVFMPLKDGMKNLHCLAVRPPSVRP